MLPPFYVQQVFGGDKPEDLLDALTDEPTPELDELRAGAEEIATKHLGNIAAMASLAVSRATPAAKSAWSRWMGGGEPEPDPTASAAEAPAGAPPG